MVGGITALDVVSAKDAVPSDEIDIRLFDEDLDTAGQAQLAVSLLGQALPRAVKAYLSAVHLSGRIEALSQELLALQPSHCEASVSQGRADELRLILRMSANEEGGLASACCEMLAVNPLESSAVNLLREHHEAAGRISQDLLTTAIDHEISSSMTRVVVANQLFQSTVDVRNVVDDNEARSDWSKVLTFSHELELGPFGESRRIIALDLIKQRIETVGT